MFPEGDDEIVGEPMHYLDWQIGPTREMFGWKVVDLATNQLTDTRRYQSGDIWVPKKNSKTTWLMMLLLAAMKLDNHRQAQNYYMAAIEDQGEDTGWRIVKAMVRYPGARLGEEYVAWEDSIDHHETDSKLTLQSATATQGKAGRNPHFVGADEIWEWPHFKSLRQFRTGQAAQRNPFILCVSTVGDNITVPGYKRYMKDLEQIKGNRVDLRHCPLIFGAPEDADIHDRKVWAMANPGWGVTVNEETLARIYEESLGDDQLMAEFGAFHCGVWQRGSQQWINDNQWKFAQRNYTLEQLFDFVWFLGLDFASSSDMCASCGCIQVPSSFCCPHKENPTPVHNLLIPFYWVPEISQRERFANADKYDAWINEGLLTRTKGNTMDWREVRDFHAHQLAPRTTIHQAGFDRRFAVNVIYDWINEPGPGEKDHRIWKKEQQREQDPPRLIEINQYESGMGVALKAFKDGIKAGEVHHNGHPILDWNRGNARVVKTRSGLELLAKNQSTGKIDGLHAAAQAFYLSHAAGTVKPRKSVYQTRGVVKW